MPETLGYRPPNEPEAPGVPEDGCLNRGSMFLLIGTLLVLLFWVSVAVLFRLTVGP